MSLIDLYASFKDASNECMKFLDLKCFKCNHCNNCPFCELYCNLITIDGWFLKHFDNPKLLTDNTKRAILFKDLQVKSNLQYSYDKHYLKYFISYDDYQEIRIYNSCVRNIMFLCLCIIRNYKYTKIDDDKGNIVSENNNDNVLIDIGSSLFHLIIKCRCNLETAYIIKRIKENNQCEFFNKDIINEIINYTSFNVKVYYDIINNPDKYSNFINKILNLYYVKECMSCIN